MVWHVDKMFQVVHDEGLRKTYHSPKSIVAELKVDEEVR